VFFCSSAGEYEQAKPVISRLAAQNVFSHVFFFSRSGLDFAAARKETCSYSLAPIDSWYAWSSLFAALRPNAAVVVRHEFWPGFFAATRRWCPLFVLDAVPPAMLGREPWWKSTLSLMWKKWLFQLANVAVFSVGDGGRDYFAKVLGITKDRIPEIGDTKYDRVRERVHQMAGPALTRAQGIRSVWRTRGEERPILVLGSAHMPDVQLVLKALSAASAPKFRLVVVPHDLSSGNLADISHAFRNAGYTYEVIGDVDLLVLDQKAFDADMILVDTMGHLSELYAVADLAYVGGAVHAKIHNVLEPAAWGLPLTSGIRFRNSQEAILLAEKGLLMASDAPNTLAETWLRQLDTRPSWSLAIKEEIVRLSGASDRFVALLQPMFKHGG